MDSDRRKTNFAIFYDSAKIRNKGRCISGRGGHIFIKGPGPGGYILIKGPGSERVKVFFGHFLNFGFRGLLPTNQRYFSALKNDPRMVKMV